jgi:hypothetical protein
MQGQDLQDLVEGSNEWCNIPSSVRASIKTFNEIIQSQARHIHHLDAQLKEHVDRQDRFNSLTQGALYLHSLPRALPPLPPKLSVVALQKVFQVYI